MAGPGALLGLTAYLAWGIATSPLPIAGVAVMLLSERAKRTATAFTAAWWMCQLVAISVFAVVAHYLLAMHVTTDERRALATALAVLGVAMVFAGVVAVLWERWRPNPNSGAHTRAFLARAQVAGPRDAVGMALATSLFNITNLPYWVSIGLLIERSHAELATKVAVVLITSLVASSTFLVITAAVLLTGNRLAHRLESGRDFLVRHSGGVVPSFLIISGLVLIVLAGMDLGWWHL